MGERLTRYYTGGKGNYMVAAMEDSGTLQALTFLNQAGRVDLQRVLVLRTVSNYDREAPGTTAADSLKGMVQAITQPTCRRWKRRSPLATKSCGHRRALGRSRSEYSACAVVEETCCLWIV